MTPGISARDELEATVAEYRHVLSEHRKAGAEGSVRRHLHARLGRLGARFEHLLGASVADESTRAAWRRCLHEGGPPPAAPPPLEAGRGRVGSSARSSKRLLRRVPAASFRAGRPGGRVPPQTPSPGPSKARRRGSRENA